MSAAADAQTFFFLSHSLSSFSSSSAVVTPSHFPLSRFSLITLQSSLESPNSGRIRRETCFEISYAQQQLQRPPDPFFFCRTVCFVRFFPFTGALFLPLLRTTRSKRNESACTTSNKRKRDGAIRPWSLTTAAPLSLQRKRVKAHRGRFFRSHLRGASTIVTRAPLCRNVPWGGLRAGRAQDQVRRAFIHRQRLLAETAISVAACPLGLAIIQSNSRTVMPCRQEWRNV